MQQQAILVGASGLIGSALQSKLANHFKHTTLVVRRPISNSSNKVMENTTALVVDFSQAFTLPTCDALFCALGTTIKTAGSQEAFRTVDFDYVIASAHAAKSHIVETYAGDYAALNPDLEVRYFSWTESIDIANHLFAIPQAAHVTIVGHSYGADTAFSVMKNARTIDVLISIDPVGRFKVPWSTTRSSALKWLNVRAEPDAKTKTTDDTIAWVGGKYTRPPARGEAGAPDVSHIVNATHGAFRAMMRSATNGFQSGSSLLGGKSVA